MKIEISDDVLFQEVGGETVLLDLGSEQYFGLDAVGTRIWQLLGEGAGAQTVVETLMAEYDVEREILVADLSSLLDQLAKAGLIRLTDS